MKMTGFRNIRIGLLLVCFVFSLASCKDQKKNASYKDGVYAGRSSDYQQEEHGNGSGYGEVDIEISDNRITSCVFRMYKLDGTVKDETYGQNLSREYRLKAQKAVQSAQRYARMTEETGKADDVDAISGATVSHQQFKEAVSDALNKAKGKN